MKTALISLLALCLALMACVSANSPAGITQEPIKIGIVTDLNGPAAYWGQSTRAGAEIAAHELRAQGYPVEILYESYPLTAKDSLTSAEKLVHTDNVDAIYSEFNPAAIAISSKFEEMPILHVYDSAVTSPLDDAPYTYKTYLDYHSGCREIARVFKQDGVKKIGVLKILLEAGELCLLGVQGIYPDALIESYEFGQHDFRTQFLKFKEARAEAVINVGFEGDTLNALKSIKEHKLHMRYGTVEDTITDQVLSQYPDQLKGALSFGFPLIDPLFREKLNSTDSSTDYGAALAYTHIRQMVKALSTCKKEIDCVREQMDLAQPDLTIGFRGFQNHTAILDIRIITR